MRVLLSIKPEFAEKIFSGEKLFEYRKTIFKKSDVSDIVIYSTLPVGQIVGEFKIEKILADKPENIWQQTAEKSGISKEYFFKYFENKSVAYAIKIQNVKKYNKPIAPYLLFPHFTAPQSFRYIE